MLTGCHVAILRYCGLRACRLGLSLYRCHARLALGDGASCARCHGVMSTCCHAAIWKGRQGDNRRTRGGQRYNKTITRGGRREKTGQEDKRRTRSGDRLAAAGQAAHQKKKQKENHRRTRRGQQEDNARTRRLPAQPETGASFFFLRENPNSRTAWERRMDGVPFRRSF